MKLLKKYLFLIGIIIFVLIIIRLDLSKLVIILSKIDYIAFILACLSAFLLLILKAYRWNYLKKKQNINYDFKNSVLMYGAGTLFGILTPGKLGDLVKVIYLKKDQYPWEKSLVTVILDRIFDIAFLIFFGYLGMLFFLRFFQAYLVLLSIIILVSLLVLALLIKTRLYLVLIQYLLNLLTPSKYQKFWKLGFQDFISSFKIYKSKNFIYISIITLVSWLVYYFMAYCLIKAVAIEGITIFYLTTSVTVASLAALIPISISGLGTREATIIFLFSFFGIPKELSLSFSLLIFSMCLLEALFGLICWLIKPIKI